MTKNQPLTFFFFGGGGGEGGMDFPTFSPNKKKSL